MAAAAVMSPPTPFPSEHTLPSTLQANEGQVPESRLGWLRPTPASTPIAEMRQRLEADGYLLMKGLIPRSDVLQMREHYFSQFKSTGLVKADSDAVDGIYNDEQDAALHRGIGGGEPMNEDLEVLTKAHTTPHYRSFVAHPKLREMVRELMGWEEDVLLQRTMLRHNVPGGKGTGVHYDKLFLRGGDAFFLTAWVPIGDVRHDGGGLVYLENSVNVGDAIENDFNERAKDFTLGEKISAFNRNMTDTGILNDNPPDFESMYAGLVGRHEKEWKWLVADYEAGDVVFHHPTMVHGSVSNMDPDGKIRLSTDLRFYDKKDFDAGHADDRWMKYWTMGDGL